MGLVVGGSGTKTKTANASTGKVRSGSGTGKGAAALREDLARNTGIDTGPGKGYKNALVNTLAEKTTPSPNTIKSSATRQRKRRSLVSPYSGISGGSPVPGVTTIPRSSSNNRPVRSLTNNKSQSRGISIADAAKRSGLIPDPDSWTSDDEREQVETNRKYEDLFSSNGMSDKELDEIDSHGSLFEQFANNPATEAATDITLNPWSDVDINELQVPDYDNDFEKPEGLPNTPLEALRPDRLFKVIGTAVGEAPDTLRSMSESMFDENGNYKEPKIPKKYRKNTSNTTGNLTAIDDGTMDYDHLTADRVTGEQLQKYHDLGMGGRDWWEIDPYYYYLKSDEAQHHDFKPWVPDDMTEFNMNVTSALDTPSDLAGMLSDARVRAMPSYMIRYDEDKNPDTTDDVTVLNGKDWDYRNTAYYHNMAKLAAEDPDLFLSRPEDDKIHGAPVTTNIHEHAIKDRNGNTVYTYGNIDFDNTSAGDDYSSYIIPKTDGTTITVPRDEITYYDDGTWELPDWVPLDEIDYDGLWTGSDDSTYRNVQFSDGTSVEVPVDEWNSWFVKTGTNKKTGEDEYKFSDSFPTEVVTPENASGVLPDDLDSLNDWYRENEYIPDKTRWYDFPVQYVPDLVMADGTRITYPQFEKIYHDELRADKDPGDFAGTNVAYDYTLMNKPRTLMKSGGQLLNEDYSLNWDDVLPGSIDMTLGSLPISFEQIAWPYSITQALSKSASGLEANGYDSFTDSDVAMSGKIDEDTGKFTNTASDVDKIAAVTGNTLVPLTENIAGNVSGRSLIPALSGDIPMNPTMRQLGKAWLLGNLGEGIEEIPGNLFDELTSYADKAYGMPIDPDTGEPLVVRKTPFGPLEPVKKANGSYKFVDKRTGEPETEKYDSMGHIYKDPNTSFADRAQNFLNGPDILNALAGGYSVGSWMSAPNLMLVPSAIRNTNYRKRMGLPQYIEPEDIERQNVNIEDVKGYLRNRK